MLSWPDIILYDRLIVINPSVFCGQDAFKRGHGQQTNQLYYSLGFAIRINVWQRNGHTKIIYILRNGKNVAKKKKQYDL